MRVCSFACFPFFFLWGFVHRLLLRKFPDAPVFCIDIVQAHGVFFWDAATMDPRV